MLHHKYRAPGGHPEIAACPVAVHPGDRLLAAAPWLHGPDRRMPVPPLAAPLVLPFPAAPIIGTTFTPP